MGRLGRLGLPAQRAHHPGGRRVGVAFGRIVGATDHGATGARGLGDMRELVRQQALPGRRRRCVGTFPEVHIRAVGERRRLHRTRELVGLAVGVDPRIGGALAQLVAYPAGEIRRKWPATPAAPAQCGEDGARNRSAAQGVAVGRAGVSHCGLG